MTPSFAHTLDTFVTRRRILAFLSLILVWTTAALLPQYRLLTLQNALRARTAHLPTLKIDYHPTRPAYNASKLALLIEPRPLPHLVPQLLHMMSVVPPDWRFLVLGSARSVAGVTRSRAVRARRAEGRLDVRRVPAPWRIDRPEDVSRMLTDAAFYETVTPGVEWLLRWEADSMLCANAAGSVDDWLEYSWAGAPRYDADPFAGNGGLTLRRLSAVRRVLRFQARDNDTEPEDEWFGKRIVVLPHIAVANASLPEHFAVESVWHDRPMGYHVPEGGTRLAEDVWKARARRRRIFEYCPELSMVMPMKLENERCEGDQGDGEIKAVEEEVPKEEEHSTENEESAEEKGDGNDEGGVGGDNGEKEGKQENTDEH